MRRTHMYDINVYVHVLMYVFLYILPHITLNLLNDAVYGPQNRIKMKDQVNRRRQPSELGRPLLKSTYLWHVDICIV